MATKKGQSCEMTQVWLRASMPPSRVSSLPWRLCCGGSRGRMATAQMTLASPWQWCVFGVRTLLRASSPSYRLNGLLKSS